MEKNVLELFFKTKVDVQSCSNHRGIMLLSHIMKKWYVVEAGIRREVVINEQQHNFMLRKRTTDVMFALRVMEKYREGLKELHFIFLGLEKADDRAPREELMKSGVARQLPLLVAVVQIQAFV